MQQVNRYTYGNANPISNVDRSGLCGVSSLYDFGNCFGGSRLGKGFLGLMDLTGAGLFAFAGAGALGASVLGDVPTAGLSTVGVVASAFLFAGAGIEGYLAYRNFSEAITGG